MKKMFRLFTLICCCTAILLAFSPQEAPADSRGGGSGECTGDVNQDGQVDVNDLIAVLSSWGACPSPCPADLNGDEVVNVQDLVLVITNFGPCGATECQSHADCDDGDACTFDVCINGICYHFPIPQCN